MALPLGRLPAGTRARGARSGRIAGTVRGVTRLLRHASLIGDATAARNPRVLASLFGPAFRGLIQHRGHDEDTTGLQPGGLAFFDWKYRREHSEMSRLYEAAKESQWNAERLPWATRVDPRAKRIIPDEFVPTSKLPLWRKLSA